ERRGHQRDRSFLLSARRASLGDKEPGSKQRSARSGRGWVGENLGRTVRAGVEQTAEDLDRPLFAVGFAREHVVKNQVRRGRRLCNGFRKIAQHELPAETVVLFGLPTPFPENSVGTA